MKQRSTLDRNSASTNRSLAELFSVIVEQSPEATAIIGQEATLSYAELNDRADQLARWLRAVGVRDGAAVGVLMDRSVELIIALVAVIKAGGCYVALDNKQPAARSAGFLRDAGANVLITRSQYLDEQFDKLEQVLLEDPVQFTEPDKAELVPGERASVTDVESLAYIAYTSGSTGTPKGVCVPHRAVSRLVIDAEYLPIRSSDVFLQLAPVAFDASTLEIWGALLNGATLVLAPPENLTITELSSFISRHKITVIFLTTGLFHLLGEADFERLRCLRYLITGGEIVSVSQINKAFAALPETVVIHAYGPTENTTFTTCHPITARVKSAFVPLGTPIDGTTIYLLNEQLDPVPPGVVGELFAAGAGLARGYVNNSELTVEKFIADPFSAHPGARMYRTGDLARQCEDGSLEFVGRTDAQIKVRGFRVEPAEIEAVLKTQAEVADACVVLQSFPGTEKRLTAFYASQEVVPTAELRRLLFGKLPEYMIPARFCRVDALPLKPNGKIDRASLMDMRVNGRPDINSDFRAPESPIEKWLSELWSDLLEISEVGVDDDFFELGGHSLLAVRITGEIGAEFDVHISSQAFYENPTVRELASALESLGITSVSSPASGEA